MVKQYDSGKDVNELIAEIEGKSVYFSESGNTLAKNGDDLEMSVTAKKTFGASDVSDAKVYAAVYDSTGRFIDCIDWDYSSGATNSSVVFPYTGDESVIKTFCWSVTDGIQKLSAANVFDVAEYID